MSTELPEYRQVFSAEHRRLRVRFLMYVSLGFLALMMYATWTMIPMLTTGVEPNGDPIEPGEVVVLMLIAQAAGWGSAIGMHLYGRCYVVRIFRAEDVRVFETIGWLSLVPYFVGDDDSESYHFHRRLTRGRYNPTTGVTLMHVDAPYHAEKVKSRRLPFIIDDAGVYLEG